jgi:CDP-diacylglycerol--glycerol-3-phosphate 3-phosphatidyltransferase
MSSTMANRKPARRPSTVREEILNLPNVLTLGRVVVIPFVVWLMLMDTRKSAFAATLLFSAAAITDYLDGWIARRRGQESLWGKWLDPVADKLIVMATTITLVHLRITDPHSAWFGEARLPLWLVVLLLSREIAITSLRALAASEGFVIEVNQGGKWKTALQLVGLIALLVGYTYEIDYIVWSGRIDFIQVGTVLLGLSVLYSLTSAWEYMMGFISCIQERENYAKPQRNRRRRFPSLRRRPQGTRERDVPAGLARPKA